jgi:hypothetical protein
MITELIFTKKSDAESDLEIVDRLKFPCNSTIFKPLEEALWYHALKKGVIKNGDRYGFRPVPIKGDDGLTVSQFRGEIYDACGQCVDDFIWGSNLLFKYAVLCRLYNLIMHKKILLKDRAGYIFLCRDSGDAGKEQFPIRFSSKYLPEKRLDRNSFRENGQPEMAPHPVKNNGHDEKENNGDIFTRVVLSAKEKVEKIKELIRTPENRVKEIGGLLAGEAYLDPEENFPWLDVREIYLIPESEATSCSISIPGDLIARTANDYSESCGDSKPFHPLVGWMHSHIFSYLSGRDGKSKEEKESPEIFSMIDCYSHQLDWSEKSSVAMVFSLNHDLAVSTAWYGWCGGEIARLNGIYERI